MNPSLKKIFKSQKEDSHKTNSDLPEKKEGSTGGLADIKYNQHLSNEMMKSIVSSQCMKEKKRFNERVVCPLFDELFRLIRFKIVY